MNSDARVTHADTVVGEKVERPPMWVMRQAGRYLPEYHEAKGTHDFFECCRSPEIASTLTLQPIERFAGLIDGAIIFSDILVIPQAMGMEVIMVDKKGPHFPDPLMSPEDKQYQEIMDRDVDVKETLDYVYKAITMTRQKLDGRVPLYGFCGAPWTLLSYMVEGGGTKLFKQVKTWIFKYPEESKRLLQKIAELCVEYLALQVVAGAQVGCHIRMSRLPLIRYRSSKCLIRGLESFHQHASRPFRFHISTTLPIIFQRD